jgi:MFS family permease
MNKFEIDEQQQQNEKSRHHTSAMDENKPSSTAMDPVSNKNFYTRFTVAHQGVICILVNCAMNLLNNCDRYILSSVLTDIETFFNITKSTAGLLQTVYLVCYMIVSPFAGYLGDRIDRKWMLFTALLVWGTSTVLGSLCNKDQFYLFVASRCLFGVATGIFGPLGVPILGDRFADNEVMRARAVMIFGLGPPMGIGLSYIIGILSNVVVSDDWRWAMRFTPLLLVVILIVLLTGYIDPPRGKKKLGVNGEVLEEEKRSFFYDCSILFKNKSYMLLVFTWAFGLSSYGKHIK